MQTEYDQVKAQALAQVASTIGAIPGCYLSEITKVSEHAAGTGRTKFLLRVMGRNPALTQSEMTWGCALDLRLYPDAGRLAAALLAAFAARLERQRQRAAEAIEAFGHPVLAMRVTNDYRHIAVDRMGLWAIMRVTLKNANRAQIGPLALIIHARGAVERAVKLSRETKDTGGARLLNIREVKLANGIVARQVGFETGVAPDLRIMGSSIVFRNLTLPDTVMAAAPGRSLGEIFDLASGFGRDFASRFGMRRIQNIESYEDGCIAELDPDLIRLGDIPTCSLDSFERPDA